MANKLIFVIKIMQKFSNICAAIGKILATVSGFIMLFSLLIGVFTRYLPFLTSAIWTEEIARMMMLWITTTGASVAFSKRELVNFNILIDSLPKKLHEFMDVINSILILIVLGVLLHYGYDMLLLKMKVTASATHLSYFWWALGFYIGFVLMTVHAIRHLVESIYILSGQKN
ncbi:MAG: TRAP transporter small permease [Clostridiales bacterium]|nr:TRAP transporter small permease [Clostridiales bacterium]